MIWESFQAIWYYFLVKKVIILVERGWHPPPVENFIKIIVKTRTLPLPSTNIQARKIRKQSPAKLAREVSDNLEQVQQLLFTGSVGLRGLDIPQPSSSIKTTIFISTILLSHYSSSHCGVHSTTDSSSNAASSSTGYQIIYESMTFIVELPFPRVVPVFEDCHFNWHNLQERLQLQIPILVQSAQMKDAGMQLQYWIIVQMQAFVRIFLVDIFQSTFQLALKILGRSEHHKYSLKNQKNS